MPPRLSEKAFTVKNSQKQTRINPDSRPMLWLTVLLVFMLGLTSFMVSFNGLHDVAGWVGLPVWMRWTVPIFIDIAILAYSMAAVIHRTRGEPVALTWATLGVFTLISVVANGAHALAVGEGQTALQSWIGAAIAAAAPLSVFAATEELSRLAFGTEEAMANVETATDELVSGHEAVIRELTAYQVPQEDVEEAPSLVETSALQSTADTSEVSEEEPAEAVSGDSKKMPVPVAALAKQVPESAPAVSAPVAATTADVPTADIDDPDLEVLRPWVLEQISQGIRITGTGAGELIGKSSRTGLNKLKALRQSEPELFAGEK